MKAACIQKAVFLLFFAAYYSQAQTTYYSNTTTTNFNILSGWSSNPNGTGTNPSSLNNGIRLVVQNGHTKVTSSAATINRLTIENGGSVTANHAISLSGPGAAFILKNGATYIHNNSQNPANSIFSGAETIEPQSNFLINDWSSATTSLTNNLSLTNGYYYGNLTINWLNNNAVWQQGWNNTTINLCAGNLEIQSTGSGSLAFASNRQPTVVVEGDFIMRGGTLNFRSNNGGGGGVINYLNVTGDIIMSGGTLITGGNNATGIIRSVGTGTATWSFTGGTRQSVRYEIAAGKTIVLASDFDMGSGVTGNKLVVNGILDAQAFRITDQTVVAAPNYVGCLINGTFRTASADGLAGLPGSSLSSTPAPLQARFGTGSRVIYYRAGTQVVSQAPSAFVPEGYEHLQLDGGGAKQLQGNTVVNRELLFTASGNFLNIGSNNLQIAATGSIAGAGSSAYIITQPTLVSNGRLQQDGLPAAARLFPIGTAALYLPLTITPAAAGSNFSASVFINTTTNGLPGGPAFDAPSRQLQVNSVWRVDRVAGTAPAHLRFEWLNDAPLEGSGFTTLPNSQIGIWRNTGTGWVLVPPPTAQANNNTLNFASTTATAISHFGTAGTGMPYIIANANVLTGMLRLFQLQQTQQQVTLQWEVFQPTVVASFEVQRSSDGRNFTGIHTQQATAQTPYRYADVPPYAGRWYYRLRMIDGAGMSSYSDVVHTQWKLRAGGIKIMGNPVQNELWFTFAPAMEPIEYRVLALNGSIALQGRMAPATTQQRLPVRHLPSGVYQLQLHYANGKAEIIRFIKQ